MRRLFEAGKSAWPNVALAEETFAAHVKARADGVSLETLHGADLFLACACGHGDDAAIAAFEARYVAEVPLFLRGVEQQASVVEEVKQLVRERLLVAGENGAKPKVLEYSGRGTLASWVRVVTLRIASNRRRATQPHRTTPFEEGSDASDLLPAVDPELAIIKSVYKNEFNAALREAFAALSPRERTLFRMHFVDGLNIDRIGTVFHVHRATVARWIAAAREQLVERTMATLGERLRVPKAELESLLRVVRSSLDVSLQSLLAAAEG